MEQIKCDAPTFMKTNAGKGFKIVLNGEWFYTSRWELIKVLQGKSRACKFRTISNEQPEVLTQLQTLPRGCLQ